MVNMRISTLSILLLLLIYLVYIYPVPYNSSTLNINDREDIVYIAVVIHMNQLLEDIRKINIYGRNAYIVFYPESMLVHEIPSFKLTIDITGPTLHSLMASAPEIIENIREGVEKGSIEILGITYGQIPIQYLPWSDVVKHVEYENKLIKTLFNTSPRGIWQEDRQWTHDLIGLIDELGFEYTLIDDNVFWRGNPDLDPYEVYYPHIACDEEGHEIVVYHISEFMRYHFRDPGSIDDIKEYLWNILSATRDKPIPPIVVYGDDAEFGLSYEVISSLANVSWIRFVTLSEYLDIYRDKLTPANYNVIGAYREYEEMFGRDWYRWYNSSIAYDLQKVFSDTRKEILLLENTLGDNEELKWILDYAWTTLLLAEWQYGPFYNTWINSNLYWTIDSYLVSRVTRDWYNGSYGHETYNFGKRTYYAYISSSLAIVFDPNINTLRLFIDYIGKKIYSPLRVFEGSNWWRYSEPGFMVFYVSGSPDVEEINHGYRIHYIEGKCITIELTDRRLHVDLDDYRALIRVSPGGFNNYLYTYSFNISYRYNGYNLIAMDSLGNSLNLSGITYLEHISIEPWYLKAILEGNITIKLFLEKPLTHTPADNKTTQSVGTTTLHDNRTLGETIGETIGYRDWIPLLVLILLIGGLGATILYIRVRRH